jgi:serine/threonine protein phosphatase PrpC
LSEDHKPENPKEYARITAAGGYVMEGRVNGNLNLSRAIGDLEYKQSNLAPEKMIITAFPDIKKYVRS